MVQINEPLITKDHSFKAEGYVEGIINGKRYISCKGKLILYFLSTGRPNLLKYGDHILIHKPLQPIRNSGNPGAFDYQQYMAFQQVQQQVFLRPEDWVNVNGLTRPGRFRQFIYDARDGILSVLRKKLSGGKDELGIAEALLIGYANDLDKDLVQAYSNTGVVHIIAISGMHLGLIYVMLLWLFARIPLIKKSAIAQAILLLSSLWIFSLVTGGSASVIRSAVMFTFITLGKTILARQTSIYASLSASAFAMLCYNPYYLWDVGFQLSYLAVTGIVIFQRPVHNMLYVKNKWLNRIWQLAAVSLAAQLLTFPACIYYFHQFPNLFLLTNIIAVPLSALILYAEIGLIIFSYLAVLGEWLGKLVSSLVWLMNQAILQINQWPFAVWDRIPATVLSTWLMYGSVILVSGWLITKNKAWLRHGLLWVLLFSSVMTYEKWRSFRQQKIIVYNIPRCQAIDLADGNAYFFIGDSLLVKNGLLQNFHLKPGRILLQLNERKTGLPTLFQHLFCYQFAGKRIVVMDRAVGKKPTGNRLRVDMVILSKNLPMSIGELQVLFDCRLYIFDGSNVAWRTEKWRKECRLMNIPSHEVARQGALVMDIGI